ncbi:hypothetical protein acsn021_16350 [Anaerocolumna cellulosilytica]|uniref:Uncharacterized protein n=1 Tax=Anaerocolumna cellulosilytica TaxID=433286 RepID=A0A6S6QWH4_9FIRM|nr:hypothetical protein [Anaerocolumna cellulosilytica]MBB5197259.1 hypothetical protein [Anaerocolumna cellulosilytica]BCJ94066.1 hypothetical protein acsn021_16350 [Anaerocolumna cellulosilytica]
MIIDIDIKIADNNGKVIHRFAKQFDERVGGEQNYNVRNGIKKEFQDFLNEYLSASGRTIRERLISTQIMYLPGKLPYETFVREEGLENGLEYKISIGNRSVFMGNIPIERVKRIERIQEAIQSEKQRKEASVPENIRQSIAELKGAVSGFEMKQKETDSQERQKKNIQSAVTKYEATFCVEETKKNNYDLEDGKEIPEVK